MSPQRDNNDGPWSAIDTEGWGCLGCLIVFVLVGLAIALSIAEPSIVSIIRAARGQS